MSDCLFLCITFSPFLHISIFLIILPTELASFPSDQGQHLIDQPELLPFINIYHICSSQIKCFYTQHKEYWYKFYNLSSVPLISEFCNGVYLFYNSNMRFSLAWV